MSEESMLEEALKVIEAARALRLEKKGKLSGSGLTDKLALAHAIDGLREAIEEFDRLTGQGLGTPGYQARPDFATPPQFDDRGFVEKQELIDTRAALPGMVPVQDEPELDYEPEFREPSAPSMSFSPSLSIPAGSAGMALDYLNTLDLGDMEFNDGAETVGDFLESLDMIADKLQFAVSKVGWTPRLRALAEAANVAKRKMVIDVADDGYYVRVPAQSWSSLTAAIADAATARDNNLTIPVPTPQPRRSHELDQRYAPKPPGYGF
ncbi:hypothetical protein [Rhizobium sp. BK176]|uniref:hypothetical protein n=1 Tax=Rhizobium sp. BK176 TaxID=2587071 RepID=UPI002169327D|nr:hypothetical protein [Rhizobium sp. BK176]MCS4089768.1 hypothetical protein [Rhizobium sp. BK176]